MMSSLSLRFLALACAGCVVIASTTAAQSSASITPPPPPRPLPPQNASSSQQSEPKSQAAPAQSSEKSIEPPASSGKTMEPTAGREKPLFVSGANVRNEPRSGFSVAVFGGADVSQTLDGSLQGTAVIPGPPPTTSTADFPATTGSTVSAIGGIKLRYDWDPTDEPIEQFASELRLPLRLSGALEAEAFYLGNSIKAHTDTQNVNVNLDSAVFMMNFLLTGQTGKWRPYIGPGAGLAYISASGYDNTNSSKSSDEKAAFAYQAIAGTDYFVTPEWSLFAEYRYLVLNGFSLYDSPAKLHASDLENHAVTMGLRKTF